MKSRQLLIDAHNLMHKHPQIKKTLRQDHLLAMREICRYVSDWCVAQNRRASLIFDGVPQIIPGTYARLKVRFSRERTADEVIIAMLSDEGASQNWSVVTDDTEIRQKAFFYGVDVIRCDPFLGSLKNKIVPGSAGAKQPPKKKKAPVSVKDPGELADPRGLEADVDLFMRLFKERK
ncbi:YacP-like NYN domain-containing protein [Cyclonatronum proteinivorum]|uniref:YacP-like NYN domain-containing protein n=1 Tax=Cyclonatronum proteinivorum TaxID=1457365 RepID=A0A345UM27_9BACT|nr:NYN domain-containing protein [Cyclonatronum proteinivorum]AXJ01529.1 YacP-like NYN domain-containing protein [Cyclonatronum proteinivorum]